MYLLKIVFQGISFSYVLENKMKNIHSLTQTVDLYWRSGQFLLVVNVHTFTPIAFSSCR